MKPISATVCASLLLLSILGTIHFACETSLVTSPLLKAGSCTEAGKCSETSHINQSSYNRKEAIAHPQATLFSLLRDSVFAPWAATLPTIHVLAIQSWMKLVGDDNVILFFDSYHGCSWFRNYSANWTAAVRCSAVNTIAGCMHPKHRIPVIPCVFRFAHSMSRNIIMIYMNSDTALPSITAEVVRFVFRTSDKFSLVSQRVGVNLPSHSVTLVELEHLVETKQLRFQDFDAYYIDMFVYSRLDWDAAHEDQVMPPFVAGVWKWDNWLLADMLLRWCNTTVIDVSLSFRVWHLQHGNQNHPYDKHPLATYHDSLSSSPASYVEYGNIANSDAILSRITNRSFVFCSTIRKRSTTLCLKSQALPRTDMCLNNPGDAVV